MARVELTDLRVPLSASISSTNPNFGADAIGRGLEAGATALDQLSALSADAGLRVGRQFVQRQNEREYAEVQNQYWAFENDLLRGELGVLGRPAQQSEGVTQETVKRLEEHVDKMQKSIKSGPVRDQFFRFTTREIARTRDTVAGFEQQQLEGLRVSAEKGVLTERMRKVETLEPQRFLPGKTEDGVVVYADPELILDVESSIEKINRGMADSEVTETARALIAERAAQSIFYMLDQNPGSIGLAKQISEAYGDQWGAQTRAAVDRRVDTQIENDMMDPVVAESAFGLQQSGKLITAKALSDSAVANFKSSFKSQFGTAPSDDAVQEVRRRAAAQAALIENDIAARHEASRGADYVRFLQTVGAGDPHEIEAEAKRLLMTARGERDVQFAERMTRFLGNAQEAIAEGRGASAHPKKTTMAGKQLIVNGFDGMGKIELLNAAAEMSESDFNKYVGPVLGYKGKLPDKKVVDAVLDKARYTRTGQGPYQKNTTTKTKPDAEYVERFYQLNELSERFFETNQRQPSEADLLEMAQLLSVDLDDSGFDAGVSTSLGQFLFDPGESRLSAEDPLDRRVLQLLTDVALRSPTARMAVLSRLKTVDVTPEILASDPELTAELLEAALLLDMPVFRSDTATRGFRTDAVSAFPAEE